MKHTLSKEARAFFKEHGKKGGDKLLKAKGKAYYSAIAKKRWQAVDKSIGIP
jgi:hypothetical protein